MVKAKCSLHNHDFGIEFRKSDNGWLAGRTIRLSTLQATRGFGEEAIGNIQFDTHYGGCPSCRNQGVFKCGPCQALNCQGSAVQKRTELGEQIYVTCAHCGQVSPIEGIFQELKSFSDI